MPAEPTAAPCSTCNGSGTIGRMHEDGEPRSRYTDPCPECRGAAAPTPERIAEIRRVYTESNGWEMSPGTIPDLLAALDAAYAVIGSECPIGDLSLVRSLQAERAHLCDQVSAATARAEQAERERDQLEMLNRAAMGTLKHARKAIAATGIPCWFGEGGSLVSEPQECPRDFADCLADLIGQRDALAAENARQREQVARMREALDLYADYGMWHHDGRDWTWESDSDPWEPAVTALAAAPEGQGEAP